MPKTLNPKPPKELQCPKLLNPKPPKRAPMPKAPRRQLRRHGPGLWAERGALGEFRGLQAGARQQLEKNENGRRGFRV